MENSEDLLIFASDEEPEKISFDPWKILIVDDDESVHEQTKRVLADFIFEERKLMFLEAYTGEAVRNIFREHPDIAIVLLDVVMESDDAGLKAVKVIREELNNKLTRIILRTGQPGQAPEKKVIIEYDIDDYKSKTELTVTRLYTTIISALRAYRTLKMVEKNKEGLEKIIESSRDLFKIRSMNQFAQGILIQVTSFLEECTASLYVKPDGFTARYDNEEFKIIAGTGRFSDNEYQSGKKNIPPEIKKHLTSALKEKKSFFTEDSYVAFIETADSQSCRLLYLNGCRHLSSIEKDMINIFLSNITVAFDNIFLNNKIIEGHRDKINMQRGVLSRLNMVIGMRSRETENHVNRVADFSALLARKLGMSDEVIEMLHYASPMHDIGKLGISDSILLKPAKLSDDEFAEIKKHAEIGARMLYDEASPLLRIASDIADTHHEKWDGTGYPHGLKGEQIPIYGRITAICDVFDALTAKRPYKEPWPVNRAEDELRKGSGKHFDPALVNLFLENMEEIVGIMQKYTEK